MVCLLKPQFAEEGTNEKKHQQDVYPIFLEFLNVVASQSITKFSYSTNIYNAQTLLMRTKIRPFSPRNCYVKYLNLKVQSCKNKKRIANFFNNLFVRDASWQFHMPTIFS